MNSDGLLANLNQSQYAAVSSFADTLAILAGPGSGKTHTLTSRTAWLLAQGLKPWNVIVATFTVKAAREMKERIGKLLGNGLESKLVLGTFHSVARRYLVKYGHLIDLKKDFGVAESADSLAIIKRIIKRNSFNIDAKAVRSRISGRKSRGETTGRPAYKAGAKTVDAQEFETCYLEYQEALERGNLLDYDDILLRCVELLRNHPSCVSNVEAVLIDEFQDTNVVQFDLMRLFAAHKKRITIVGDPDQSIYGFRAAEIRNYKRMLRQYPDTVTIALEENYRSSAAILMTALTVIQQDTSRVAKSLQATHVPGTRPVLRKLSGAHKEAEWIVTEVKRILGLTGDLLDLNDFAILLRSAALSRLIEIALGKVGIAYRMVGGLRFYDRAEVKAILDYLRVIKQPDNSDAIARIVNVPKRRVGDTAIKALLEEADTSDVSLWTLMLGIVQGRRNPKKPLNKQAEHGVSQFVNIILTAQSKMSSPVAERLSTVELIEFVIKKTDYRAWIEEQHGEAHEGRWANVEELIYQATEFQTMLACGYEDEGLPEIDGLVQEEDDDHLSKFLANIALASEVKKDEGKEGPQAQLTISTIHAAKGLEWPVVFIPAVYQGSIPHSRAEDQNEERRLLYVAMTRAKALLYMSCPLKSSQNEQTTLSPFLSPPSLARHLEKKGAHLGSSTVSDLALILRRNLPSKESLYASTASVENIEDDLFPIEGEEDEQEIEKRWDSMTGNPTFTMGQQAPKRRRIELGRSVSNPEVAPLRGRPSYYTTMDRASSFTIPSAAAGFVTAGLHMQVLKEHSVNCAIGDSQDIKPEKKKSGPVSRKAKVLEGQGTLLGFLGKPNPQADQKVSPKKVLDLPKPVRDNLFAPKMARNLNQARQIRPATEPMGIPPALANHRVGPAPGRPHKTVAIASEQPSHSGYVFLSSSPQRPLTPISVSAEPIAFKAAPGLTSKPALLSFLRPNGSAVVNQTTVQLNQTAAQINRVVTHVDQRAEAVNEAAHQAAPVHQTTIQTAAPAVSVTAARTATTFHEVSMSILQQKSGPKTLGVRRSMNGWSNRKGQGGFVPPSMKKPRSGL